ncbi:MAG: hypothetical protein BGP01_04790 [Paludibacter sp. 47-17]|nr:MAG: hypothetical protein BGP01_04790 [Paludibacter sp. 47-17]
MTKKLISILTGLLLMFFVQHVNAQLLVEDFEYAAGSLLTANGWTAHSGAGTQAVDVTTGLSFAGYKGSDVGGAANLDNNGEDVNKVFTAQTSGTVYVAAIVKIDAGGNGGYFFHLGKATIGTAFTSRVWVNADGNGVGLTSGSTAPASYTSITPGVPFMIVLKHDFAAKKTSLYVLNSYASAEPSTAAAQIDETQTEIGSVALRQYNAAQRILVDGIRVGTSWAEAMAPAGVVTKVSTPNLNPGGGSFTAPLQVSISSATEGASIYYTLDGSEPDNTKTLYTAPIQVAATTTIKAIAYKTGLDASNVATATYSFPTEVATIADLRAHTSGLFKLTGEAVLTFKTTERNAKYVQDATGGVLIDDASGIIKTAYNLGDGITGITGTLGVYAGMLQFTPVADPGAATSTSNAITPKSVALEEMVNNPGQLVKVSGVTIGGEGPFVVKTNYTLNGSSSTILRTAYNDLPYIDNSIPQGPQDITGVVLIFNNVTQLVPRTLADFTPTVITSPTLIVTEVMPLFGVNLGQSIADTVYVDAFNLTENVTVSVSGEGASAFSVSPASLTPTDGTLTNAQVIITYNPATAGDHVATLTFASAGAADVVKTLTGKAFSMNGDGSPDRPFTVGDVIAMNNSLGNTQKYWVKGYIVGTATSGNAGVLTAVATTAPFSNTSLAIADAAGETSLAAMIPVQLPVGDIRAALNLLDNPGNMGKLVRVYGTLEAYFNTPGVRGVSEFNILSGLSPVNADQYRISARHGLISIDAANVASVEVFNAVGQLLYSGRLSVGQNSIRVNNSGVAIIKIDGAVGKVIM